MTWSMVLNGGELMRDGEPVRHETDLGSFTVSVVKDGTGFGNREPLTRTLNTLMTQGSWEVVERFGNRSPALVIEVEGETADGLNAGEVWLSALMGDFLTPNWAGALKWLPPRQSVWTVFDIVSCYIDRSEDGDWDLDEDKFLRTYKIPVKALPHARSDEPTVTPAAAGAGTPAVDELVSDGSAATRWSASSQSLSSPGAVTPITPTVVSGAVRATHTNDTSYDTIAVSLKNEFEAALPGETPYLRVDYRIFQGNLAERAKVSTSAATTDVAASQISTTSLGGGVTQGTVYYRAPFGTTAITMVMHDYAGQVAAYLEVDQIRRVSHLPAGGTSRQKLAALYPGGSAPADGSLHVGHPTVALGKTIVYTFPLGRPSPALTQWRTSSPEPVNDATMINGKRIPGPSIQLTIPNGQIPIRGLAALWAKVSVTDAPVKLEWVVNGFVGTTLNPTQTATAVVPVGAHQLVPFDLVTLPGLASGPAGATLMTIRRIETETYQGSFSADEMWAFGQDENSALLVVDAGSGAPTSGGPSNNLWINAPSAANPAGEVLIGTSALDARAPATVQAGPQVHKFPAAGVSVLTVTFDATDADTDLLHYMRWSHHAAKNK